MPAKSPSLRKKLRKCVTTRQTAISSRLGSPTSNSPPASRESRTTESKPTPQTKPSPPLPESNNRPTLLFRREERPGQDRQPAEPLNPQAHIVPELSHLAAARTPPAQQPPVRSEPAHSAKPKMRRRAKTPILSIGQLEGTPRSGNGLGRTSSVDLIAEQYQALLESRHSSDYLNNSEPRVSSEHSDSDEPLGMRRRQRPERLRDEALHSYSRPALEGVPNNPSSTSDDGTLVSFQEETVYFKPFSVSPEPQSPAQQQQQQPLSRQTTADSDNVSLQICLDLLTRELASATAGHPFGSPASTGTSALQIWVMIEAYEKLRDQMAELGRGSARAGALEAMFDTWLRALYAIHESMVMAGDAGDAGNVEGYGTALGAEYPGSFF